MRLADINENLRDKAEMGLKMRMAGWSAIGNGVHGVAWIKNDKSKNYVLKAFNTDTGYFHFYNVVRKNQGSPNLPTLFGSGITKLKFKDGSFLWMVKLERLVPLSPTSAIGQTVDVVNKIMRRHPDDFFNPTRCRDVVRDYSEAFYGAPDDRIIQSKFNELMINQPEYYRTLQMLNNYKESIATEMYWDLHSSNVMTRGGGSILVVLDPWVSYSSPDARQDMIDRIRQKRRNGEI